MTARDEDARPGVRGEMGVLAHRLCCSPNDHVCMGGTSSSTEGGRLRTRFADAAAWRGSVRLRRLARLNKHVARVARLAVESRDSQRLLQQALQAAAEALHVEQVAAYLLDETGLELRTVAALGLSPGESIGMRIPNRHEALAHEVRAKGHALVVTNDGGMPHEADAPAGGTPGWRGALAVPLFDGRRVIGVLAVCAHRTSRFDNEDVRFLETLASLLTASLQRERSDSALSHAQGLKSVGQLAAGTAHDFNNLLMVISGSLQVLGDRLSVEGLEDLKCMVEAAARACGRGAELAGKLLAFSRRLALRAEPVDAGLLLRPLANILARTLDQRIRVTVDVAPDCPPCLADPGQLESALLNLAINARDAMLDGGTLSFRAWPVDSLPADSTAGRPGAGDLGYVAISVSDTGTGMSDAVKQHALEPFFTTKAAGRGTGLGLSTVFGFMEQSHGGLTLDSAPGKGTTITLYLPQHGVAEARAPVQPPAGELVQHEDRRIDHLTFEAPVGRAVRCGPAFCQDDIG